MILFLIFLFCNQKNRIINEKGECICKNGYFGTDLSDCWICIPKCHLNSQCISNNICKCNEGYYGDGILNCLPNSNLPVILDYFPKSSIKNLKSYINIQLMKKIPEDIEETFIKFNYIIIKCNHSIKTIFCEIPEYNIGNISIKVSFDRKYWSNKSIYFQILPEKKYINFLEIFNTFFLNFFLIIIFYLIFFYKNINEKFY